MSVVSGCGCVSEPLRLASKNRPITLKGSLCGDMVVVGDLDELGDNAVAEVEVASGTDRLKVLIANGGYHTAVAG